MPYGRLYDDLHKHRKTRRALAGGDRPRDVAAMGLWVLANSWCLENYGTDGWVPSWELSSWDTDAEPLAARLVAAGYWTPEQLDGEDGYRFTDWADRQKSAEQIDAERKAARERMRSVRANTKRSAPVRSSEVIDSDTDTDTKNNTTAPAAADAAFDAFWSAYPRKTAKATAAKAWAKATKTTSPEQIMAGLGNARAVWTQTGTEQRFIPHPGTWLNAGRWADEHPTLPDAPQQRRTLAQCNGCTGGRHDWTDGRNLFVCMGAA